MATVNLLVATASTTGGFGGTSGSFIPTSGALLIVFCCGANVATGSSTLSGSGGMTFTASNQTQKNASVDRLRMFLADSGADASSQTVTWNTGADGSNGFSIHVLEVVPDVGESVAFGASAPRQATQAGNQAAGTPALAFSLSCLTGNPTISYVANETNPAGITNPTDWTVPTGADVGYSTPTQGATVAVRNSGFTGTTITWGSSTSEHGILQIEVAITATGVTPRLALLGVGV